jgi:hypothetical protein
MAIPMSAPAEGTIADGPNGQTAVFTGGKWVVQGSQQMPLPQGDEDAIKRMHSEADDAAYLDYQAGRFMRDMGAGKSGVGTGPGYNVVEIPHVADNINPMRTVGEFLDPRLGDMQAITNQTWVHLRPTGSGRLMQPEVEGFQQAFPNIENWGNVNGDIAARLHDNAQVMARKLKFVDNFIRAGKGTYADANAAWQSMGNGLQAPITPDGRYMPAPVPAQTVGDNPNVPVPGAGPQPGTIDGGYQFVGGDASDPRNWRPAPTAQTPRPPPRLAPQ